MFSSKPSFWATKIFFLMKVKKKKEANPQNKDNFQIGDVV